MTVLVTALPAVRTRPFFNETPRIDRSNPLTRGLRALFVGSSGFELVNGILFSKNGSPSSVPNIAGGSLRSSAGGGSYDGWYAPEQTSGSRSDRLYNPTAPPVTLFVIAKSVGNASAGIGRGNGSPDEAWSVGLWEGAAQGAHGSINCSTATVLQPASNYFASTARPGVAVLSIGAANYTLWGASYGAAAFAQEDTGSTPSGNFYYEYSDQYRCLSYGSSFKRQSGDVNMGGMIAGVAWSKAQALSFLANPWQLFEP